MPEGHTLFRLAQELDDAFAGRPARVSSPQDRFTAEAAALDGSVVLTAESGGKHLFIEFEGDRFVHVHLGLFGKFRDGTLPEPAARGALRMRLVGAEHWLELRGPTACELLTPAGRDAVVARLGPDPLRPNGR